MCLYVAFISCIEACTEMCLYVIVMKNDQIKNNIDICIAVWILNAITE